MKHLLVWLCANVLNLIGGLMVGLSIPTEHTIFNNAMQDILYVGIPGILLFATSYYFKFIYDK